jgi:hypothetical protein
MFEKMKKYMASILVFSVNVLLVWVGALIIKDKEAAKKKMQEQILSDQQLPETFAVEESSVDSSKTQAAPDSNLQNSATQSADSKSVPASVPVPAAVAAPVNNSPSPTATPAPKKKASISTKKS